MVCYPKVLVIVHIKLTLRKRYALKSLLAHIKTIRFIMILVNVLKYLKISLLFANNRKRTSTPLLDC